MKANIYRRREEQTLAGLSPAACRRSPKYNELESEFWSFGFPKYGALQARESIQEALRKSIKDKRGFPEIKFPKASSMLVL